MSMALALALLSPALRADDPVDWSGEPVLPKDLDLGFAPPDITASTSHPDRIRLFRIVPGFLADPVGLEDDTPEFAPDGTRLKADDGPSRVQVAIGNDNPFFDVRYANDPGGIGYTRLQTQVQLLDLPSTSCTVGFRAVTPTGAQQGGLEDGPTVFSPAFSLFHSLEDGTAFQGFIAKDLHVINPANLTDTLAHPAQLNRSMEYGMAVQRPLLPEANNLFFFVEALGHYRFDTATTATTTATAPTATMDLLPGMHLKLSDNWWMSGGVILPVNRDQPMNGRLWQFTCSFQF